MSNSHSIAIGKLFSILYRKSSIFFQKRLNPPGLTLGQVQIFKYLAANKEATQQDITDFYQLEKSSTSYLISRMLNNGYLRKEPDPEDHRSQKLNLTDKGQAQLKEIESTIAGWTEQLFKGFSPEEKEKAFELLNRMVENIRIFKEDEDINGK